MDMQEIYRKVAEKHGVSPEEVEREIKAAIDMAWNKTDKTESEAAMQADLGFADGVPQPEDVILAVAARLRNKG